MNNIDSLVLPALLLDVNKDIIDIVIRKEHLKISTKLGLKKNILKDTLVFDSNNKVYNIIDVKNLGLKNSFWKFEFFNPMYIVDLVLEDKKYNFQEFKLKLIEILNKESSVWGDYPFKKSLIKEINKSSYIKEVIECFTAIEA